MKGVILGGGTGSRLFPLTKVTNKHLLPVYNRPMIYYPIECLVKSGIDEILLVTGGENAGDYLRLLGNGKELGVKNLHYTYQEAATGIAGALSLAEDFADGGPICLVLGDNILEYVIQKSVDVFRKRPEGARILLAQVQNPQAYGVADIDGDRVVNIIEKPKNPKTNWAVIGIYFYDNSVFDYVKKLTPSARGELEITDVNNHFIKAGKMAFDKVEGWWADAGENIDFYLQSCIRVSQTGANHPVD
ncbi:MAG: Glucose-1-phosphate thymidylyltransferase [Phycisphaerae bacterium]|nr:Glucose-1-phosphate thymidylyltransferase [Phycisphaerae bacterium]